MKDDERIYNVASLLFDYVKSPSLRHIRDPHFIHKLAKDIIKRLDDRNSIWRKWDGQREVLLKSAFRCWIPIEDLQLFLNSMSGPALTLTDVNQRLRALDEEERYEYRQEELRASCLKIYFKEKALGTELPAIIQLLRDHVDDEEQRLSNEQQEKYRVLREQEREVREHRLLSGADCKWTQLTGSKHWFCRTNGRLYRLSQTNDKRWGLYRAASVAEAVTDVWIGKYQQKGDATKTVAEMAYKPELMP